MQIMDHPWIVWTLGVLLALGAILALAAAWMMLRYRYTPGQSFWYSLNFFFNKVLWRTKVSGSLPIGPGQGAIVVCNHRSGIDPLLIQMSTSRVVHWMVAREYFSYWIMAACFGSLQSIPVGRRGVDTAATKQAIRLASEGKLVGLFPEGRINTTDDLLLPGRLGAAMIALKARVPVIPCYIEGAPYNGSALGSFLMRARARVTLGQPIDLSAYYGRDSDKEVLGELTLRFLAEIARLAKNDSFEPRLAGRKWGFDGTDSDHADAEEGANSDHSPAGSGSDGPKA
jgi:1-acyl-sn-glycerol-3-phosphate acyltransferase